MKLQKLYWIGTNPVTGLFQMSNFKHNHFSNLSSGMIDFSKDIYVSVSSTYYDNRLRFQFEETYKNVLCTLINEITDLLFPIPGLGR